MAKYISIMILVIITRGRVASTQECMNYSVCDRAVRFMFDKVLWSIKDGVSDGISCLNEFGYPGICARENCPSFQISFCPSECKWESNNKGRNSSDHCFVVGNCTVISKYGKISATCNRTTDDIKDFSNCSAEYCNSNGRCVLNSAYNIVCNCSKDYYGDKCNHAVEAKKSDTEKTFTMVQMAAASVSSSIAGILLMSAVVCVCRLRSQGKLCFRKQKKTNEVTLEGTSNSVTMKIKQSNDNNTDIACDLTKVACDSVPGVTKRDIMYSGSDSEK